MVTSTFIVILNHRIVNEVLQKKSEIFMNVQQLLKKLVGDVDNVTLEDVTQKAQRLVEEFTDVITDTWTKLMSTEIDLHEQMQVCFNKSVLY